MNIKAYYEKDREASASEDGRSITPGGTSESGASLYSTTQDTGRRLPVVTTSFPVNVPNHHPFYRNPPQHSQPKYFEDSRLSSSHSSFPTLPSGAPPDNNGDKKAAVPGQVVKDQAANIASAAREEDEALVEWQHSAVIILEWTVPQAELLGKAAREAEDLPTNLSQKLTFLSLPSSAFLLHPYEALVDSSNLNSADVGRPASLPARSCYEPLTVFHSKATLIPSSNVPCQMNLTGPDGYIKAPPQSSSAFQSTMDCSYVITVYMGYGVEVQ
ncbi:hypothetical protein KUCAC02_035480, partial [Chaenocephalus aceratus]